MACVLLVVGCAAQPDAPTGRSPDDSLAGQLYETEVLYLEHAAQGDAYEMARAAMRRLSLIEKFGLDSTGQPGREIDRKKVKRTAVIHESVRDMLAAARYLARDDDETRLKINSLFPPDTPLELIRPKTRRLAFGLGRAFGHSRQLTVVIGREIEATLPPTKSDAVTLDVDGRSGITVYVQPVGSSAADTSLSLGMIVSRRGEQPNDRWVDVDCPETSTPRLPCFVPAGNHTQLEIALRNDGQRTIEVVVFISGKNTVLDSALNEDREVPDGTIDERQSLGSESLVTDPDQEANVEGES